MDEKMAGFVRTVRRRNVRETVVAVVLIGFFGYGLFSEPRLDLGMAGRAVLLAALVLILAVLWGKLHIPASELAAYPPAQHPERWRSRMTDQARWLRLAWLWYVLPLFAGIVLVALGRDEASVARVGASVLIAAALSVAVGFLNLSAANHVERERDAWLDNAHPPATA